MYYSDWNVQDDLKPSHPPAVLFGRSDWTGSDPPSILLRTPTSPPNRVAGPRAHTLSLMQTNPFTYIRTSSMQL